jgi:hypothetical protein
VTLRRSLVDVLLVARFELLRAVRSRQAIALVLTWLVANVGAAWVFTRVIAEIEASMARTMGVVPARWPGTMTDQLRDNEDLHGVLKMMAGDAIPLEQLLQVPFLATMQLWMSLALVPFLAATAASECLAPDVASRAVRYELLRTGRGELVAGRMLGQVALTAVAVVASLVGVWCTGMLLMVHDPFELAWGLALLGSRSLVFALPFLGVGVGVSQLTSSAGWARVLALSLTAASFVVWGVLSWVDEAPYTWIADVLLPVLPQTWMAGLWRLDAGLVVPVAVCAALGVVAASLGGLVFARRDL